MNILADLIFETHEWATGRPDLVVARGGETLSTSDFVGNVHGLVLALEAAGLQSGQRVAVVARPRPEWLTIDLACLVLGAVSVPLGPKRSAQSLGFALRNAGVHWIFYDRAVRESIATLVPSLAVQPRLVTLDGPDELAGTRTLTRLLASHAERRGAIPLGRFRERVQAEDPATILYRDSARPEGLVLPHRVLTAALAGVEKRLSLRPSDRVLSTLAPHHTLQRLIDLSCLRRGATLLFDHTPDPGGASSPVAGSALRPTVVCAEPDALRLACRAASAKPFGPTLRLIVASRPLDASTREAFAAQGTAVMQAVSAAGTVLTLDHVDDLPAGAVGRSIAGVALRADEAGEILARGPAVSEALWQRDEGGDLIGSDGWLRTTIRGSVDPAGFLVPQECDTGADGPSSITSS